MQVAVHATSRNQAGNIRAQRDLIDQAAQVLGKSRSDFMLETACREAEDVLLDNPPQPSDELRALLLTKPPWE